MNLPYNTYGRYLKHRFGRPVVKVPLNAGFSCPNKESGRSGCTFCDTRAFSPVARQDPQRVASFLTERIARLCEKASPRPGIIAYLQPNTNTYAPLEELALLYKTLLAPPDVVGLAVGTRPDALSEEVLDLLGELGKTAAVSLELGLQSMHDSTLRAVQRGHTYDDFVWACKNAASRGIEVVAHIIAGLPGEEDEDVIKTVSAVSALPVQGIKIHQLMIVKNTPMEELYLRGQVRPYSLEKYGELLVSMIGHCRSDIIIHRIMADTPRDNMDLLAPLWSKEKKKSLSYLQKQLCDKLVRQGMFL
ncbi:MAG: TIGR01212 family radical SAM protein [Fibrobacterota bacterium]